MSAEWDLLLQSASLPIVYGRLAKFSFVLLHETSDELLAWRRFDGIEHNMGAVLLIDLLEVSMQLVLLIVHVCAEGKSKSWRQVLDGDYHGILENANSLKGGHYKIEEAASQSLQAWLHSNYAITKLSRVGLKVLNDLKQYVLANSAVDFPVSMFVLSHKRQMLS